MKYKAVKINGKQHDVHRVVMENHLGHQLTRREVVHHKDGNTENNDIRNLQVMSLSEHSRMHMKDSSRIVSRQTRKTLRLLGRHKRPAAKLQIQDIPVIRSMLRDDIKQWLIAWIYQVDNSAISKIRRGVRWVWVT